MARRYNRTRYAPGVVELWEDFDSIEELVNVADTLPYHRSTSGRDINGNEWMHGAARNATEARRLLRAGIMTDETRRYFDMFRPEIEADMQTSGLEMSRRRRHVWADAGDEIDADRLNTDHERPWRNVKIGQQSPIIRIGWNLIMSCGNEGAEFAKLGARVCAVSDLLTTYGFGVEIVGLFAEQYDRKTGSFLYRVPLKRADEPLDIERVGSAAQPATYRDIMMRVLERDMPGLAWNGPCSVPWTPENKRAAGVDYVAAQNWSSEGQRTLLEACSVKSDPALYASADAHGQPDSF